MINRTEAERLSAGIHAIRPDWPMQQLMTLIGECKDWPLQDLAVGLSWVATDRSVKGEWASKSPYRVREEGPWRTVGIANAEIEEERRRDLRDRQARREHAADRLLDVDACTICDDVGRLENGNLCWHDERSLPGYRSPGAALARQALADARAARQNPEEQQ